MNTLSVVLIALVAFALGIFFRDVIVKALDKLLKGI